MPIVLGVAGGSGSGKSTVVREVVRIMGSEVASILHQDAYYRDITGWTFEERAAVNFDHPDSLETPLLAEHLRELVEGRSVQTPTYDFSVHRRRSDTVRVDASPIIVVDGILVLADADLRELMDYKVFVDTDADLRLIRRVARDTRERGRTAESVIAQYERTVRPMHLEFVQPSQRYADMTIPEGGYNRVAVDLLVSRLERLLAERPAGVEAG